MYHQAKNFFTGFCVNMNVQRNNYSPNFHAGLTKQMRAEIGSCDINKISKELAKNNIQTDFKNNKVIAWCCFQTYKLFKSLKLPLPNGIFVENFKNLNVAIPESLAFSNIFPCEIYKNKKIIVPEKTLFFQEKPLLNEFNNFWESIDEAMDMQFAEKHSPNNHFLYTFLHEFSHVAHEDNLINTLQPQKVQYHYDRCNNDNFINKFKANYFRILSTICSYATESPNEAVACDMADRFVKNMDKETLRMKQNFIPTSPYKKLSFKEKFMGIKKENNIDNLIRNFWYGKIDLQ